MEASYHTQTDLYHVRYDTHTLTREDVVETIRRDGEKRGLNYTPSLVDAPPAGTAGTGTTP